MATDIAKRATTGDVPTPKRIKREKDFEPVGIVMDDEDGNPLVPPHAGGDTGATASAAAATMPGAAASAPAGAMSARVEPVTVQKVNWRYLAQTGADGRTNFSRLVTISNLKNNGCFISFNGRQYEKETGERFNNAASKNALTIEGPPMKVVYTLKNSEKYEENFTMALSTDCLDADPEVRDFANFIENVFDDFFKTEVKRRAYEWMTKDKTNKALLNHKIVERHIDNKSSMAYQRCWQDGSYTQEQYEADVEDCIKCSMRTAGDGNQMLFFLKAYPVDKSVRPCEPDVLILDNDDPPQPIPYFQSPLFPKEGEYVEAFVRPVFSINRLSFAQEKYHITPVLRILQVQSANEATPTAESGVQQMAYQFAGKRAPVIMEVKQKQRGAADAQNDA